MTQEPAPKFSYEFFPPRNLPMEHRLWRTIGQLERLNPEFFSMTYGALGSAQQVSIDTAISMHNESPVPVAAHLTCADSNAKDLTAVVRQFQNAGIKRIVALRGDAVGDEKPYAYESTIDYIQALTNMGDFDISVAAYPEVHPQAFNAEQDLQHLKAKFDAGANQAITQFFYDVEAYLRFRDRAVAIGINKPIIPGILPIHDFDKVQNFAKSCAASLPGYYQAAYRKTRNDAQATYNLSRDLTVALCETLMSEGVDQFHLYTLNQTDLCLDISLALGAEVSAKRVQDAA